MTLAASRFLTEYKTLKSHIEGLEASEELRRAYERLVAVFKSTYTAESLKEALAADVAVPDELEERLTSALVLYHRERTASASRVRADQPAEP
jgi:hypothetical protein